MNTTKNNVIEVKNILSFLGIEFINYKGHLTSNGHKTAKTVGEVEKFFGKRVMSSGMFIEDIATSKMFDFRNDWNMLMLVVNEIESLGYSVNQSSSMIYVNGDKGVYVKSVDVGFNVTRIQALYKVCLSFIRIYNQDNEDKASGWDNRFPFEDGDDYYVVENNDIIWSCWDDMSEEIHDAYPNKVYYKSVGEAVVYLKTTDYTMANVFDYGDDNNYNIQLK